MVEQLQIRWTLLLLVLFYAGLLMTPAHSCRLQNDLDGQDNGDFFRVLIVNEELEIGTAVGSLNFSDYNSVRSVSIEEDSQFFTYNFTADQFYVKSRIDIDEGLQTVQTMLLLCHPKIGPFLQIEVEFEIQDMNDFSPEFRPSSVYNFSISEMALVGVRVGLVEAYDRDRDNSYVTYELVSTSDSEKFKVETFSGGKASLVLESALNYELQREYLISVIAKDCQHIRSCADKQRSATAQVLVRVEDADDLSPEFDKTEYRATIFEDTVEGAAVVQVVARDQDELNEPVRYSLIGTGSEFFTIDSNTGMVKVSDTAGIVRSRQYLLQATAWQINDVTKKAKANLVIKIVATNGNAPQFSEDSYTALISEGSPVDTTALTLTVTDRDTVDQLLFSVIERPEESPFTLHTTAWNSAEMVVSSPLDFERTRQYNYTVQVSDGEYMDRAEIRILILNENDMNPVFDKESYQFSIKWAEGATVGQVKATDEDMIKGEVMSYEILPPHNSLFGIDNHGWITLSAPVQEYDNSRYVINVRASDSDPPPRTSISSVRVNILDLPPIGASGTDSQSQNGGSDGNTKNEANTDKIVIYAVSSVAACLLLFSAVLLLCFLRRRAKKTARQLKKDTECATPNSYDKSYQMDSMKSGEESDNSSCNNDTLTTATPPDEDRLSEVVDRPVSLADRKRELELPVQNDMTYSYRALSEASTADPNSEYQSTQNNLSNPTTASRPGATEVSDTEMEYRELCPHSPHSDDNNTVVIASTSVANPLSMKYSSDSGRSSLRETRSPFMQRVPFRSFQHTPSASLDETGNNSQDEEVAYASHQRLSNRLPVHSNSFNVRPSKPDISNIRAREGPPVRAELNSGFIAEAPVGFRSREPSRDHRINSPFSSTSDYSSNSPTPELVTYFTSKDAMPRSYYTSSRHSSNPHLPTSSNCDLPPHHLLRHDNKYGGSSQALHYSSLVEDSINRSEDRCVSPPESEYSSVAEEHNSQYPQMTIYF